MPDFTQRHRQLCSPLTLVSCICLSAFQTGRQLPRSREGTSVVLPMPSGAFSSPALLRHFSFNIQQQTQRARSTGMRQEAASESSCSCSMLALLSALPGCTIAWQLHPSRPALPQPPPPSWAAEWVLPILLEIALKEDPILCYHLSQSCISRVCHLAVCNS